MIATALGTVLRDVDGVRLEFTRTYDAPVDAVHSLAALTAYAHWRERDPGAVPLLEVDEAAARRMVNLTLGAQPEGRTLTPDETAALLRTYGIQLVPSYPVRSLDEAITTAARLGWNVVLKATSQAVRGRPDQASVVRNIDDPEEMKTLLDLGVDGLMTDRTDILRAVLTESGLWRTRR